MTNHDDRADSDVFRMVPGLLVAALRDLDPDEPPGRATAAFEDGNVLLNDMLSIDDSPVDVAWQIALHSAAIIRLLCDMLDTEPEVVLAGLALRNERMWRR
jgi:hypothetical protein